MHDSALYRVLTWSIVLLHEFSQANLISNIPSLHSITTRLLGLLLEIISMTLWYVFNHSHSFIRCHNELLSSSLSQVCLCAICSCWCCCWNDEDDEMCDTMWIFLTSYTLISYFHSSISNRKMFWYLYHHMGETQAQSILNISFWEQGFWEGWIETSSRTD